MATNNFYYVLSNGAMNRLQLSLLFVILLLTTGCQTTVEFALPTLAASAATLTPTATPDESAIVAAPPPTWTPASDSLQVAPTLADLPTRPPDDTPTPWPTPTNTPTPSATPTATPTEEPPTPLPLFPGWGTPLPPPTGPNLLPNPSFEEGWYHWNGVPELQVPHGWQIEWDEGYNPLYGGDENPFLRPETRVLPRQFLPPDEHATFIWHGTHTYKVFKGYAPISFRLFTDVYLPPGLYQLEIHYFPDLVVGYNGSQKIWAPDPLSGEARIIAPDGGTNWIFPMFGVKNSQTHVFEISEGQTARVGAAFRGRWGVMNNGWFMDDWSLRRLQQ
jgi:hypothetical protein